jgi:hypothetical protein
MRAILELKTIKELKKMIRETNITGYSKLNKKEIIDKMMKEDKRFMDYVIKSHKQQQKENAKKDVKKTPLKKLKPKEEPKREKPKEEPKKEKFKFEDLTTKQKKDLEEVEKYMINNKNRFEKSEYSKGLNIIKKFKLYSDKKMNNTKLQYKFSDYYISDSNTLNELSMSYKTYYSDGRPTSGVLKSNYLRTINIKMKKKEEPKKEKKPNKKSEIIKELKKILKPEQYKYKNTFDVGGGQTGSDNMNLNNLFTKEDGKWELEYFGKLLTEEQKNKIYKAVGYKIVINHFDINERIKRYRKQKKNSKMYIGDSKTPI